MLTSAVVSDPLHLLDICATSDGAAAVVLTSIGVRREARRWRGAGADHAISTVTPTFPQHGDRHADCSRPTPPPAVAAPERTFKESIGAAAYEEAGIDPDDVSLAEVYDLSTALELDWIEDLALCKRGEAEHAAARRRHHDRRPDPGQPVAAAWPASARPCPPRRWPRSARSTWQLRGQAEGRQVEGARVGITANQGLFGHGSSVILSV